MWSGRSSSPARVGWCSRMSSVLGTQGGRIPCTNPITMSRARVDRTGCAMALTITLDEALTTQLRQHAAALQVSLEECAAQLLSAAVTQLADTARWQQHNQRRVALIHKSMTTPLSREEAAELEQLQAALDQRLEPMDEQLLSSNRRGRVESSTNERRVK